MPALTAPSVSAVPKLRGFFRLPRTLLLAGVSSLTAWLRKTPREVVAAENARRKAELVFSPQIDIFEGRFHPGSLLGLSYEGLIGAGAVVVDESLLNALKDPVQAYWDLARSSSSEEPALSQDEPSAPAAKAVPAWSVDDPSARAAQEEAPKPETIGVRPAALPSESAYSFSGATERVFGLDGNRSEDFLANSLGLDWAAPRPLQGPLPHTISPEMHAPAFSLDGNSGGTAPRAGDASPASPNSASPSPQTGGNEAQNSFLAGPLNPSALQLAPAGSLSTGSGNSGGGGLVPLTEMIAAFSR